MLGSAHTTRSSGVRFLPSEDPSRFWAQVDPAGCWEWNGGRDRDGYGQTRWHGKRVKAHRKAWSLANGGREPDHSVLHRCDNPPCVRPDHLYDGTQAENDLDRVQRGHKRGIEILNAEAVRDIRRRYPKVSQEQLAEEYGVVQGTISKVIRRKTWKSV